MGARTAVVPAIAVAVALAATAFPVGAAVPVDLQPPASPQHVVGFTTGHGERSFDRAPAGADGGGRVTAIRELLAKRGQHVCEVGGPSGLGVVPDDVGVLLVLGPHSPFRHDELASLERFVKRGGRLLIALDPDGSAEMGELLAPFGMTYWPELLANDKVFARRAHSDKDRMNLVTGGFPKGSPLATLHKLGTRSGVVFPGAGRIEIGAGGKATAVPAILASRETFIDRNGNLQADRGEERGPWILGAAVMGEGGGRLFLLGDSDCLTDRLVPEVPANTFLAIDILEWLSAP
jgi:gliding motility-associatede transport system auxiliary component